MVNLLNTFFNRLTNFSYFFVRIFYDSFFLILTFLIFFNIQNFFETDVNSSYANFIIFFSFFFGLFVHNVIIFHYKLNLFAKTLCIFFTNLIIFAFFITPPNFQILFKFFLIYSIFLSLPRFFADSNIAGSDKIFRKIVNNKGPILVIGGAGYIGSHLVEILLKNKNKVRVLDNFMYSGSSLDMHRNDKNLEIVKGECTDYSVLIPAMDGCSAVIHLAGLVGDPACAVDANLTRYTNILSTRLTFLASSAMGIQKFIFASSCSVYGVSDIKVDEKSKLNPVSLYAETKIDSENELLKLGKNSSTSVTILRFATVFGHSHRPRFDLVANIFSSNIANGKDINVYGPQQWRPFIHVYDIAKAIQIVIEAKDSLVRNQIFNVGDDDLNMTLGDLARRIFENYNKTSNKKNKTNKTNKTKINFIDGNKSDMRNYMVSFEKINKVLNFKATRTVESGSMEIIDNFYKSVYGNPKSIKYSNYLMTKKYLKVYNKKKSSFESIPIYHV